MVAGVTGAPDRRPRVVRRYAAAGVQRLAHLSALAGADDAAERLHREVAAAEDDGDLLALEPLAQLEGGRRRRRPGGLRPLPRRAEQQDYRLAHLIVAHQHHVVEVVDERAYGREERRARGQP